MPTLYQVTITAPVTLTGDKSPTTITTHTYILSGDRASALRSARASFSTTYRPHILTSPRASIRTITLNNPRIISQEPTLPTLPHYHVTVRATIQSASSPPTEMNGKFTCRAASLSAACATARTFYEKEYNIVSFISITATRAPTKKEPAQ